MNTTRIDNSIAVSGRVRQQAGVQTVTCPVTGRIRRTVTTRKQRGKPIRLRQGCD
ncbi:MAG TPA: hypothetical protein VFB21_16415 [Chthonomonadaceae bacterium]|nr:hypothetical protein [Chthonomonadaceae bacterium]